MSIIDFTKNFYPQNAEGYKRKKNAADSDSSDEDDRMKQLENLPEKLSNLKNIDILLNTHSEPVIADGLSSSLSLNTQSRIFKQKMDQYENMLKKKLNSRYVNVKKAFLDLDVDNSGTIQAEELAKLIKFSDLQEDFNFTLLEYLIKIKCNQDHTDIDYKTFCNWLGSAIEPVEPFYFRHD